MVSFQNSVNKRGQLSIEFILILSIVLILMQTIVIPMRDSAEQSVTTMTSITYLDKALHESLDSVDKLSSASEGRLSLEVYVPESGRLYFTSSSVNFDVNIDFNSTGKNIQGCNEFVCTKSVLFPVNVIAKSGLDLNGPNKYQLVFTNAGGIIEVSASVLGG